MIKIGILNVFDQLFSKNNHESFINLIMNGKLMQKSDVPPEKSTEGIKGPTMYNYNE
jgi:hypothetical protein